MKSSQEIRQMRKALLTWYAHEGRTLPWRIRPDDRTRGVVANPYKIWLSEIMCQQTTTTAASAYWYKFLAAWPSVQDLAAAPRDDVLTAWAGLGYYARARNLHKCANVVCTEYGGTFPTTEAELLKLPGIGPYSAASMAAICYGEATNVVDGNVERVISRIFRVQTALPKAKSEIRNLAAHLADPQYPGDYAQALMDLGAHVCRPKNPKCTECPWQSRCAAFVRGDMRDYPKRQDKTMRPVRYGAVFLVESGRHIWLRQRPDNGLLGGMMELPGTEWTETKPDMDIWFAQALIQSDWHCVDVELKHVFTHFILYLTVFSTQLEVEQIEQLEQVVQDCGIVMADLTKLNQYALPSLMKKAVDLAKKSI